MSDKKETNKLECEGRANEDSTTSPSMTSVSWYTVYAFSDSCVAFFWTWEGFTCAWHDASHTAGHLRTPGSFLLLLCVCLCLSTSHSPIHKPSGWVKTHSSSHHSIPSNGFHQKTSKHLGCGMSHCPVFSPNMSLQFTPVFPHTEKASHKYFPSRNKLFQII